MLNINTPENIRLALDIVEEELIILIGSAWAEFEQKYRDLYRALTDEEMKWLASVEIIELFAPYITARQRLNNAIVEQDIIAGVLQGMAKIAESIGVFQNSSTRLITMQSPIKVKSIKLGNFEFDFGDMSEICANVILTGNQIEADFAVKKYVLVAAGVLLMARSLSKAFTTELSEREATVFYGFTQVADKENCSILNDIREKANEVRAEINLELLDEAKVMQALHNLGKIKSVLLIDDKTSTWCIIEKYQLKSQ